LTHINRVWCPSRGVWRTSIAIDVRLVGFDGMSKPMHPARPPGRAFWRSCRNVCDSGAEVLRLSGSYLGRHQARGGTVGIPYPRFPQSDLSACSARPEILP